VLGIIGAIVGGFIFARFGAERVSDLRGMLVAVVGASVVLVIYHALFARRVV